MKCIILIGYMCAGKTTVGRELAKRLGRTFYDLDWYIEERYHKKVSEIFAEEGEERFRDLERRMLHEVAEFENIVLSCGGGTPCFFDNMAYMNEVADTYYLKATPDTILEHLKQAKGKRPLLENKSREELDAFIRGQLAERTRFYEQAKNHVNLSVLEDSNKVHELTNHLHRLVQENESKYTHPSYQQTDPDHAQMAN